MLYPYPWILLSNKKEGNTSAFCNMKESWKHYISEEVRPKEHIFFYPIYIKGAEQANLYTEKDNNCLGIGVRWGMGINCS